MNTFTISNGRGEPLEVVPTHRIARVSREGRYVTYFIEGAEPIKQTTASVEEAIEMVETTHAAIEDTDR